MLVKAVTGPRGPAAHHLLSSLAELVQFHGNYTVAVRSGAVQVLIYIVESTDGEDLAGTSLAVLGLLSRFDEGLNALRKTDGIVSVMVNVLKGRCMLSQEGAAETLLRLFDESEGCVRDACFESAGAGHLVCFGRSFCERIFKSSREGCFANGKNDGGQLGFLRVSVVPMQINYGNIYSLYGEFFFIKKHLYA